MLKFTIDGVFGEIVQRVVHPAHVPFETETQPAEISRASDAGPGSGFLGDGEDAGKAAVGDFVHAFDKGDGVQIFAAAKFVGNPFARFAGIVEIKHGSDGIHAKAVDVIFVEPEESVGDEIVLDFVAAVIVDESAPIGMRALAWVGMFVEMRAVELSEAERITRKMRRSPIKQNAEAGLMAAVDESHELFWSAVAAGGGKVAKRLVAPGAIERMLHDGEKFDVSVAEFFDVGNELVAEFRVGEPAVVILGNASPGAEMHFVDGDWRLEPIFLSAVLYPVGIFPLMNVETSDNRAGVGPKLGAEGVGIGFERKHVDGGAKDFIFVDGAFVELWNENFPDAGRAARAHGMDATVPVIEIADDTDAPGAGRPDSEVNAANAFESNEMRAEFVVSVVVAAFSHEMEIEFAENEGKGVGVVKLERIAVMGATLDFVAAGSRSGGLIGRPAGFEEAFGAKFDGVGNFGDAADGDGGFGGEGEKEANGPAAVVRMRAKKRERIGMEAGKYGTDLRVFLFIGGSGDGRFFGQRGSLREQGTRVREWRRAGLSRVQRILGGIGRNAKLSCNVECLEAKLVWVGEKG